MDDPGLVGGRHGLGGVVDVGNGRLPVEGPDVDLILKRSVGVVGHDQERLAVNGDAGAVDRHDALVVRQPPHGLAFTIEAPGHIGIVAGVDDLDGDDPVEVGLKGAVNAGRTPRPDLLYLFQPVNAKIGNAQGPSLLWCRDALHGSASPTEQAVGGLIVGFRECVRPIRSPPVPPGMLSGDDQSDSASTELSHPENALVVMLRLAVESSESLRTVRPRPCRRAAPRCPTRPLRWGTTQAARPCRCCRRPRTSRWPGHHRE